MKKIHTLWICLGLFTFTLLSCQREPVSTEIAGSAEDAPITLTVSATSPEEEGEKTYIDGENKILWKTGEQMKLFIQPADKPLIAVESFALSSEYNAKSTASFSFKVLPVLAESYLYQGVYPLSACVSANNADLTAYKVVLPAVQANTSGGVYDPSAYIMIANPSTKTALDNWDEAAFRRAVALNELPLKDLPDGVTRVEIVAPEGQYLAGGRTFNLSTGADGAVYDGTRTLEINFGSALSSGDQTIRFCSWPVTMAAGSSLTVIAYTSTKSNTRTLSIPNGNPINLVQGKLNRFTVNMSTATEADRYFSGGNGTAISPWRIASSTDLNNLASYISVGAADAALKAALEDDFYLQTADIDFNNGYLESIGNSNTSPYSYFKGTYLGNGYKVSKANIRNQQSSKAVGFFGYLDGAAHIDALKLDNVTVSGTTWNVGSVVGCIQSSFTGVVENCVVTSGAVSGNNENTGGILGKQLAGTVRNCSYSGTVTTSNSSKYYVGGIAGTVVNASCLLQGCTFTGTVTGAGNSVGGICGLQSKGVISSCTVTGATVTAGTNSAGGICGWHQGGRISACSIKGTTSVSATDYYVGGISGYVGDSDSQECVIEQCSVNSSSTVTAGQGRAGGIFGQLVSKTTVNLCSASCNVTSTGTGAYGRMGGIGGYVTSTDLLIANCCYWSGTLSNKKGTHGALGGIVGSMSPGSGVSTTIFNCCAFPTKVETGSSNANIAGIIGYLQQATVRNCYCPTAVSAFDYNGSTDGSGSRGSIYGWLRGDASTQKTNPLTLAANLLDVYYLSTWKSGNRSGDWAYNRSEQSLTTAQMQNAGSVTRPSTSVSYDCFIDALNADVAAWNAGSPLHSVQGVTWVLGSNGYPVPSGLPQ